MTDATQHAADLTAERAQTHGDFDIVSGCLRELEDVIDRWLRRASKNPEDEPAFLRLGRSMVLQKISRAVAGQSLFADHWHDAAGYSHLIAERCQPPARG